MFEPSRVDTGIIAVCLPMPLIALDPMFRPWQVLLSFVAPFSINLFARDVRTRIGSRTNLGRSSHALTCAVP